jgi:hypothetical protein
MSRKIYNIIQCLKVEKVGRQAHSHRHQAPVPFSDIAAGHREDRTRTRIRIGNVVHIRRLRAA